MLPRFLLQYLLSQLTADRYGCIRATCAHPHTPYHAYTEV